MSVISTLTQYILVDGFHIVADLENSQGSWIQDKTTGKKYLDCYSQFASQALGWNHPKLQKAIAELGNVACHKMANSDMYSDAYARFVEKFAEITPDFQHYFFIDGGALAVENALKAAFDWKCQKTGIHESKSHLLDIIHFKEAFHGRSGYTMSLTNTGRMKTQYFPKFSWSRVINPKIHFPVDPIKVRNLEQLSLWEIERALKHNGNRIAAIIIEPIQGEGGDNHFRKEFFQGLRQIADDNDVLLIFDEVQTGLGLTGKMWCYEHFDVIPDILCFGKKTQVCGIAATDRVNSVPSNVFKRSGRINSTWGGNIVDMARAYHIINIIQEDKLVENAAEVGDYFKSQLKALSLDNARGRGLMIAFDLFNKDNRDRVLNKIKESMMALPCGEKSIRFRPHLTFSKEDVDSAIKIIKTCL